MPFVRVSRDKRGTEHVYLVDVPSRQGRSPRPRVLYVFRTPPGVTLGRQPFDPEVRRLLETKYPELTFDWEELSRLPAPPPDVEPWRERRRAERAAKEAARAERAQMEAAAAAESNEANGGSREAAESIASPAAQSEGVVSNVTSDAPAESASAAVSVPNPVPGQAGPGSAGRRRRRGRRRGRSQTPASGPGPAAPSEPDTVE